MTGQMLDTQNEGSNDGMGRGSLSKMALASVGQLWSRLGFFTLKNVRGAMGRNSICFEVFLDDRLSRERLHRLLGRFLQIVGAENWQTGGGQDLLCLSYVRALEAND